MRFLKELTQPDKQPSPAKPVPMRAKERAPVDEAERLADLKMVARRLVQLLICFQGTESHRPR